MSGDRIAAEPVEQEDYKLNATRAVLRERESELLRIKGHCSSVECRLHYAHSGPCDITGCTT